MMISFVVAAALGGCIEGRSTLSPNQDRLLRKDRKVFAADAQSRHYPAGAEKRGVAPIRAEVDYALKLINLVNLGQEELLDAELWVNERYVCLIPRMESLVEKTVNFQILFDAEGQHFPVSLKVESVRTLELHTNGQLLRVPVQLAD
jgi:hypothetical protein